MTRSEKKILTENFIAVTLTQIISYVIPLITLPYLSHVLGVEKFGLVFWAQAAVQYFIILTDFGFNLSAVKEISINRNNKEKIDQIFNSVMSAKLLLVILSLLIFSILILMIPKFRSEYILFYLTFFMVIGNAIYPIWFFQGLEHMKYITFLNILSKSLFLFLIFVFIKSPKDYLYVAFLNSLGFLSAGIFGIYFAIKRFKIQLFIPTFKEIKEQLIYSSEFFLSRLSVCAYSNTNAFILGLIATPTLVGYYTAAEKIYQAMRGICDPISQVMYPHVAKEQNLKMYKKIFYPVIFLLVIMSGVMFIYAKDFTLLFYGQDMMASYKVLRIFCITLLFSFTHGLIGYPVLAALGHSKDANFSIVVASLCHIIFLVLLFYFKVASIYSIAILTTLAEGIVFLYRINVIRRCKMWENL